ncbi:MgtC/SapB family protein [Xylanibacillus composti]|uniref:Transporter n=1 Tax=Xylanibacillus composti TaxID=1572762 RepID=A0A8J4H6X3_9BACL|nr:MgtC/SapB family protein [Xylanibacillus composti]MDT9723669.1 MgtC/SapB family protein [Xylanibacillus composti]GIQ71006.1 transporter [Xylanibacillus composti]
MSGPWVLEPLHILLRLALAVVLGGIIGIERERTNHAAGFRTHILVCLGAALIMLLSAYGFADFAEEEGVNMDPARLAAQVISGIGFLGAGVIMRNGVSITGLTTAASLWVVAAIGLAVGAGYYIGASVTTFLVLFSLLILNKAEKRWFAAQRKYTLKLHAAESFRGMAALSEHLEQKGVDIISMKASHSADKENEEQRAQMQYTIMLKITAANVLPALIDRVSKLPGVLEVQID